MFNFLEIQIECQSLFQILAAKFDIFNQKIIFVESKWQHATKLPYKYPRQH